MKLKLITIIVFSIFISNCSSLIYDCQNAAENYYKQCEVEYKLDSSIKDEIIKNYADSCETIDDDDRTSCIATAESCWEISDCNSGNY
ncbi:MAG: hypothetical protein OEZ22_14595 [Spirochaetia bacterium]|nr:hypothetical protein [Spirochaetia bacterium]